MKNLMSARSIPLLVVLVFLGGCVFPSLPNASAQKITAPSGPLFLARGRDQDLPNLIRDAFFALAGAKDAKIVVIPTAIAHADNPKTPDEFVKRWKDLKPLSVQVLHTRDRKTADDPAFVKPLTEATAVWFINGHPDRLLKAYRGTLVEKELKKLQARGGLIALENPESGCGDAATSVRPVCVQTRNNAQQKNRGQLKRPLVHRAD